MSKTFVALYQEHVSDLVRCLEDAKGNFYDGVVLPIVNPLFYREFDYEPSKSKHFVFSRSDLIFTPEDWLYKIVSLLSNTIDCDSDDENIRRHSEETLKQEISFAEHLIQNGHMMLKIKSTNTTNLAQIITRSLKGTFLVHIPMTDPKAATQVWRRDKTEEEIVGEDTWNWWNRFRMVADYNPKIKVALELSEDIPSDEQIQRWLGEPIECLIIPSNLFMRNRQNYPVLPKARLEVLQQFIQNNVHFLVKANINDGGTKLYAEYLKHLVERFHITDPMAGLDDVLEIPLQPLFDNLDSYTYEVFEKDPIKYKYYQNAIEAALIDKVPESDIDEKTIVVMVVGAGRGPLVRAALNASVNTKRNIKLYIIEKNPNAVITLTALVEELWPDKDIQIYSKDMRDFIPLEKADILISELLGSFGDNELSPECLDGAQKHLKKDGLSIPCKSISYLNPIMSSKLHNNIRNVYIDRTSSHRDKASSTASCSESIYVVYLKNCYHISEPKSVFEFDHPNRNKIIDNTRFKTIRFKVSQDCILNGFAGYFETVLYKDIILSTHPQYHSNGLLSWFSCFFPITEPQFVRAGELIEVNFWRCVSSHKVWYEWNTTLPQICHIHNHNGQSCPIFK